MGIDNRTLAFALSLGAIAVAILIVITAMYRKEKGLSIYAGGTTCAMVGFLLFLGQGSLTPWLSYVFGNFLMILFHLSLAWGLRVRAKVAVPWPRRFWIYPAAWTLLYIPTVFGFVSYQARCFVMSVFIIALSVEFLIALNRRATEIPSPIRRAVWVVASAFCLAHAARIVLVASVSSSRARFLDDPVSTFTLSFTLFFCALWAGLLLIMDAASLVVELERKNALLSALATTDPLTGLFNRRMLDSNIEAEMERARRYEHAVSLILFDLDHFKRVNDVWGHAAGDEILIRVSAIARNAVREPDEVYRWGGEEFFILTPHTPLEGATILAQKIRRAFEADESLRRKQVTASFGAAEWSATESRENWQRRVDRALYKAKKNGRNQVVSSSATEELLPTFVRTAWRKEWESGNKTVDEEHRCLLDMTNELLDSALSHSKMEDVEEFLSKFFVRLETHFTDEERILEEVEFPDVAEHRVVHKSLSENAARLHRHFLAGDIDSVAFFAFILEDLIIGHLLTDDIDYFPYTRKGA